MTLPVEHSGYQIVSKTDLVEARFVKMNDRSEHCRTTPGKLIGVLARKVLLLSIEFEQTCQNIYFHAEILHP